MVTPAGALALEMLVGDPTILNLAREVTAALDEAKCSGGIVGGIAVFLHGYERTTTDIDVYATDRPALAAALENRGFHWTDERRQWEKNQFPVQILAPNDDIGFHPSHFTDKLGVRVVALPDLISMKLASGTQHFHRAQDIADIIRLIDGLRLDKTLTPKIDKAYHKEYQRLVEAVQKKR